MSDHPKFDEQITRAMAHLYDSFPTLVQLDGPEHGTLVWLLRNGVVTGELLESNPLEGAQTGTIMSAQLPARTYAILKKVESNVGRPLGQAAVDAVKSGNEHDIAVVGELLVRRLIGG
jgi:hypothetical protein